jgi:endothelin-converting enzyme
MVFGAFGSVAGHELSHAFDQAGRLYNKDGKLVDWWTNVRTRLFSRFHRRLDYLWTPPPSPQATVARFEHLQACLLDQYANYSIQDARGKKYYIKSIATNGEDMADAGGLAQSFRAWTDRFESDKVGKKYENYLLPGLSYSREQLFYIGTPVAF